MKNSCREDLSSVTNNRAENAIFRKKQNIFQATELSIYHKVNIYEIHA